MGLLDYQVAGASAKGAFVEAGTVTKDGALIVDNVITKEGETVVVTTILPEETAKKLMAESAPEDKPAETDKEKKDKA